MDRAIDVRHFYGSDFDSAKEYADRIHAGGALAYLEVSHEGLEADNAAEPWGPEDFVREDGRHVFGMDRQMMEKVCGDFFQVGRFANAAGFDGVLLHGGHGFSHPAVRLSPLQPSHGRVWRVDREPLALPEDGPSGAARGHGREHGP